MTDPAALTHEPSVTGPVLAARLQRFLVALSTAAQQLWRAQFVRTAWDTGARRPWLQTSGKRR